MSRDAALWRRWLGSRPSSGPESYFEAPEEIIAGNRVTLLHDGREAYPAMLAAIAEARSTIHLESYILKSDRTGWRFASLLAEKSRAAVQVRIIFDSVGSLDIAPEYLQYLRNSGASLLEYRPVAPWRRRWGWGRRDHRKLLVVDGRVGFTGGLNIADEYEDPALGGGGWRDTEVRIEGPATHELDRLFRGTWYRETGKWVPLEGPAEPAEGGIPVRVAANHEFLHRHRIRRAYLYALKRASRSVDIANAYFVPDLAIRRALYRAVRRGVRVRVLVPGASDVPAVSYAGRHRFEDHLRRGVRLFEWPGPVLHSKTVVVDGIWTAVGSYNMDHRSWLHNLEVNLHIVDSALGRQMQDAFERDLAQSREIGLSWWLQRPLRERILERLFYLVRYWL